MRHCYILFVHINTIFRQVYRNICTGLYMQVLSKGLSEVYKPHMAFMQDGEDRQIILLSLHWYEVQLSWYSIFAMPTIIFSLFFWSRYVNVEADLWQWALSLWGFKIQTGSKTYICVCVYMYINLYRNWLMNWLINSWLNC